MLKGFGVGIVLLLGLAMFSMPVSAYPDFYLSLAPASLSVCPCTAVGPYTGDGDFEFTLSNEGDVADTYELYLEFPGKGWSGFIHNIPFPNNQNDVVEITVGPGEEVSVDSILVMPSCDVKPGVYEVKIIARSKTHGEEKERSLDIEILDCHSVELELQGSGETCKEVPLILDMSVTNYGKYIEIFAPSASVEWAKFSAENISLESGQTRTLSMILEPPEGLAGIRSIDVSIESLELNSYASDTETLNLDIQDCYLFSASLEPASQGVCSGRSVNYALRISNIGTEEDSYSIYTPDWIFPEHGNFSLDPGEARDIILAVEPTGIGEFKFNATVISSRHPLYPELRRVVQGVADSRECRGVAVVMVPQSQVGCSRETIEYQVTVKNIGTISDTFFMGASVGKLDQDKIVLEPGQSRIVKLAVGPGISPGTVLVNVNASSEGVSDEDEAELLVENCYSASIAMTPENASVCPCLSGKFEAELKNTGKYPDNYSFSLEVPKGMGTGLEESLELQPGESETFELEIPIACDSEFGSHLVKARVVSGETGQETLQEAELQVVPMGECYSLELSAEEKNLQTLVGRPVVFTVSVKNTGSTADSCRLLLVGPEWLYLSAGEASLEPGESGTIYVYASPSYGSELKEYPLKLTAVSGHSSAELELSLDIVKSLGEEPKPPENKTQNETQGTNVTGNVTINVSIPGTGQTIGIGVAISWKIITVTLIALAIVVILVTRFAILIR